MNEFQWTNETHFIKTYLSHFILERGTQFVVSLRDRWRDIYSERWHLVPYLLPGANACAPLQAVSSETSETPLIGCVSLARFSILTGLTVKIWPHGSHITWSPSGYPPARPASPDALPYPFTNHNVTACQSTRGHQEQTQNPCQRSLFNTVTNNWDCAKVLIKLT